MCLAGKWRFCLDRQNIGEADKWYNTILKDEINLPGTTDENCYGDLVEKFETDRLSQVYKYVGNAWYQRDIIIPEHWCEKHIVLHLERCHWFTKVWIDDVNLGENDSLSTGNYYDIPPNIIPGKHTITICMDNSVRYALSNHHFSNDTQTEYSAKN